LLFVRRDSFEYTPNTWNKDTSAVKAKQAAFRYDLVKKEKGEELAKCTICRKKEVVIDKRIKAVELVKLWTGGSTKKHENFTGAFLFLFFILFYYVCFSSPSRWSTMPSAALR